MQKLNLLFQNKKKLLPSLIVVGVLVTAGMISFVFSPQSFFVTKTSQISEKEVTYRAKETQVPIPTTVISGKPEGLVFGAQASRITPKPTIGQSVTTQQNSAQTNPTTRSTTITQNASAPTNTPVPQQETAASPTQTSQQAQTVSVEIKSPDGSSSFTVDYTNGMDVCGVLQKAKDSGKIKSVSFDDSYMNTLHSRYVSEINGFSNNWTFTANGNSPLGCSLYQPKPNDTIVWKFG